MNKYKDVFVNILKPRKQVAGWGAYYTVDYGPIADLTTSTACIMHIYMVIDGIMKVSR